MEKEWKVEATSLTESLAKDFSHGPIINEKGQRYLTEELVASINGLKIEIFSREHPPPHFRVFCAGETANFSIKDCTKLNGGLEKWERNIRQWHAQHKGELIAVWNRTRPTDCPIGKYEE